MRFILVLSCLINVKIDYNKIKLFIYFDITIKIDILCFFIKFLDNTFYIKSFFF